VLFDKLKLNSNQEKINIKEKITIKCSTCNKDKWTIFLELDPIDKKIYLCYSCATQDCIKKMKGVNTDITPIWGKVDITGQGYDPPEWRLDNNKAN